MGELDEIQKEAGEKQYLVIAKCQICKDLKEVFSDLSDTLSDIRFGSSCRR